MSWSLHILSALPPTRLHKGGNSESSALTDDVGSSDFNCSGGGGGGVARPNIFKDAERMGNPQVEEDNSTGGIDTTD